MAKLTPEEKTLAPFRDLGFNPDEVKSDEAYGTCPLCGKQGHFFVNLETGQWSCKAGSCQRRGNIQTFVEQYYDVQSEEVEPDWERLADDRELPVHALQNAEIAYDGERYILPERNQNGRIVNLRRYRVGSTAKLKLPCVKGLDTVLYGMEELTDPKKATWDVWLVEGHWDRIAMKELLREAGIKAIVVAVPGADTFKELWAELLTGRNVVCVYDNDVAGEKGKARAFRMLKDVASSLRMVTWPVAAGDGYDIRDFYRADEANTFEVLLTLVDEYEPSTQEGDADDGAFKPPNVAATWPMLEDGGRPSFDNDILPIYRRNLHMTEDHENGLRIIYATVISQQIEGDPVWVHVAAVPGSCKTELIMSCSEVGNVVARNSITVHSLVSGFKTTGGRDPSLLPRLFNKVFLLKDFTEILNMPHAQKHEVYGVFRGAYDGRVEKDFGNGIQRNYRGYFNMVTGVTPEIFRESNTALGERFLIYHMGSSRERKSVIRAALRTVGGETEIRQDLRDAAKTFLEYQLNRDDLPVIPEAYEDRLINLAELVAQLRANVAKDYMSERILYRPQPEVGTRLVKQFAKLLLGLGLLNDPPNIGEREYSIVQRVAIDSCVGWHFDTLQQLAHFDGLTLDELTEKASIPRSTLYDRLKDLVMLGVIQTDIDRDSTANRRGRPNVRYFISGEVKQFWTSAGLPNGKPTPEQLTQLKRDMVSTKTFRPMIRRKTRRTK